MNPKNEISKLHEKIVGRLLNENYKLLEIFLERKVLKVSTNVKYFGEVNPNSWNEDRDVIYEIEILAKVEGKNERVIVEVKSSENGLQKLRTQRQKFAKVLPNSEVVVIYSINGRSPDNLAVINYGTLN